jgi:uncharacterized protein (TIGR02596 family)
MSPIRQAHLPSPAPRPHRRGATGFSLLELLLVMLVITILAMVAGPSVATLVRGPALTRGGEVILGQLNLARQTALTRNEPIEVRLYKYADPRDADRSERYQAIQLFRGSGREMSAIGKLHRLPDMIIMDSAAALSTLLGSGNHPEQDGAVPIPGVGENYRFVSFRFLPDGSTDLTPRTDLWFLTLHNALDGDELSVPPPNFHTVQVNPVNGRLTYYRP